jgi:hypothetical protein
VRLQVLAFLAAEALYIGLHVKPLLPLVFRSLQPDIGFLTSYTTAAYFGSELALILLLALASPIR